MQHKVPTQLVVYVHGMLRLPRIGLVGVSQSSLLLIEVKYFEPSVKGICHILNDEIFPVLIEDLGQKVSPPETIRRGRRTFYCFE